MKRKLQIGNMIKMPSGNIYRTVDIDGTGIGKAECTVVNNANSGYLGKIITIDIVGQGLIWECVDTHVDYPQASTPKENTVAPSVGFVGSHNLPVDLDWDEYER